MLRWITTLGRAFLKSDMKSFLRWSLYGAVWASNVCVGSWTPALTEASTVFVVSPRGDDRNPGTEVAPFRSIARAQAAVRSRIEGMTGDITVLLRDGTYEISETLRFDHRDSGANGFRVTYQSFPEEHAILSGGRRITGWTPVGNGLVKAKAGGGHFRHLYIDDVRGVRARTPNAPDFSRLVRWDEDNRWLVVERGPAAAGDGLSSVEMVILKQWTQNNLRVHSSTASQGEVFVMPMEPDRTKAFAGHLYLRLEKQSYYFENALEFLDRPGEWYLRAATDEVFYKPRSHEDMSEVTAIASSLERLVEIQGTAALPVHELSLIGLTFEYSEWTAPGKEGFVTSYADVISEGIATMVGRVAAAVEVEYAHNLRFERNTFRRLGATGLALRTGVSNVNILGNRFRDISGSGIVVESLLEPRPIDPRIACRDILIANNVIEYIGMEYRSSVGIFAGYVADLTVEHNEIHDAPYTAISVGWGWTDTETMLRNNRIQWNRIYSVMNTMADGAGIYTLSKQPGTTIHGNYVHDLVRSPWAGSSSISGIYLDEGSSEIVVSDNVLERVPLGMFFHRATHNSVVNTEGTYEEQNGATDNGFRQESGFNSEAVKERAGLEAAYADLR